MQQEPNPRSPLRPEDLGFGQLFWAIRDAVVVGEATTGRIVLWNPAAERLFGYAEAEALDQPIEILIPPSLRDRHQSGLACFADTGHGALIDARNPVELPALRKGGDVITVELSLTPIERATVPGCFVLAIIRDATDRKRAEEHLLQSEAQLAQAQEIARLGSWDWDIAADTVTWSDQLFRIYGFAPGMVAGSYETFLSRVHPDDQGMVNAIIEHALTTPESFNFEHRIVLPDGDVRVLAARGEVLLGENGHPVRMCGIAQDITERVRAEEVLQQSEARFRATFEHAAIGMDLIDLDGRFLQVNPALCALTGYPKDELLTKTIRDITHPDDVGADAELFQRLLRGQVRSYTREKRYIRRDGDIVWVRLNVALVRDQHGAPLHVIGQVEDITERKQTEEALAHERDLLHTLMNAMPIPIYFKDAQHRFTRVNPAAAALYGLDDPDAAVGKTDFDVFPEEQAQQFWQDERPILEQGTSLINRLERQAGDGDGPRWTFATKVPIVDAAGCVSGLVGMSRDITELMRTEEALRHSEEQFRTAFTHAAIGMGLFDLDGRFLQVNAVYSALLGYSEAELIGMSFQDITHPDDLDADLEQAHQLLTGEIRSYQMQKRYIRKDGEVVWVRLSGSIVRDEDGTPLHFIGQVEDITQLKQAEDELRRSEGRFRELFDEAPVMYVVTRDNDGQPVIAEANSLFLDTIGYTREEVVGHPLLDVYSPTSRAAFLAEDSHGRALEERVVARERQLLTRDGRVLDVLLWSWPERGSDGAPIGTRDAFVDVTERRQTEEALRASEERFRAAFDHAVIGMALIAPDGRYLQVNNALCALTGYTADELLTKRFLDITHPEDLEADLILDRQLLDGKILANQREKRYIRKDGKVVWARLGASLVRDDQGIPLHFIVLIEDITERKWAEEALRQSEERFRAAFDHSVIGMALLDLDGRYLQVNGALCELTGYSEPELLAMMYQDITHPDDLPADLARDHELLAGELPYFQMEKRYIRKGGGVVWVWLSASLVRDAQGTPLHLIVLVEDITERKRLQEALRTSEVKYRTLVEHMPAVVYMLDTNATQTPLYYSPSIEKVTGETPEEVLAFTEHWIERVHPDDRERVAAEDARAAAAVDVFSAEYRRRCKDSSYIWVQDEAVPVLNEAGQIIAWQGVMLDITERKQVEAALANERELLTAVLETVPDALYVKDVASRFVRLNPAAGRQLGITDPSVAIEKTDFDFFPEALARQFFADEQRVIATGEPILNRLERQDDSKDPTWWLTSTVPLRDKGGAIVGIVGIGRDITEQNRLQAERDRLQSELEAELESAAALQAQLLPQTPPVVPGYALAGCCLPARHAGGDLFDWTLTPTGLRLVLGDVMGKGMAAALLMATARAALRAVAHLPVVEAMAAVNQTIYADLASSSSFITLLCAELDPASGRLTYVDAGHGHAVLRRREGLAEPLAQRGLALGLVPEASYQAGQVTLTPGDSLLLYSDGLPDARPELTLDAAGVAAQLRDGTTIEEQLAHLVAVATANTALPDDLTLLLLRRDDPGAEMAEPS